MQRPVQRTQKCRNAPVRRRMFSFNLFSSFSDGWVSSRSSLMSSAWLESTTRLTKTKRTAVFILISGSKLNISYTFFYTYIHTYFDTGRGISFVSAVYCILSFVLASQIV